MRKFLVLVPLFCIVAVPAFAAERVAILPPFGVPVDSQVSFDLYFLISEAFTKSGYLVLPRDEVVEALSHMELLKVLKSRESVAQKVASELYRLGYSKEAIKYATGQSFEHKQEDMRFLMPLSEKMVKGLGEELRADVIKVFIYRHGTVFVPALLAVFPVDLSKPDLWVPAIFNMRQGVSAIAISYYHAGKLLYSRYAITSFRGTVSGKEEFLSITAMREAVNKLFKEEEK